jgi:hypothetical protein
VSSHVTEPSQEPPRNSEIAGTREISGRSPVAPRGHATFGRPCSDEVLPHLNRDMVSVGARPGVSQEDTFLFFHAPSSVACLFHAVLSTVRCIIERQIVNCPPRVRHSRRYVATYSCLYRQRHRQDRMEENIALPDRRITVIAPPCPSKTPDLLACLRRKPSRART